MATEAIPQTGTSGALSHRFVETNGLRMHIAEQGTGPLLLLCHGFPERWYSWRYQIPALAQTGYHVVAPDLRDYGQTDHPADAARYTLLHLVGDLLGLLEALGEHQAVLVGRDWGSVLAWHAALMRPDRFPGLIPMSSPSTSRGPLTGARANIPPTQSWKQSLGAQVF